MFQVVSVGWLYRVRPAVNIQSMRPSFLIGGYGYTHYECVYEYDAEDVNAVF